MSDLLEQELGDDFYEDEPPVWDPSIAEVDALVDAGWHLRQIRRLRRRAAESEAVYKREAERLKAWHEAEKTKWETRIEWHTAPLRQLSERLNEADPTRKTINLPDGALKLRVSTTEQAVIEDEDALLAWAVERAPQLLRPRQLLGVMDLRRETVTMGGKVYMHETGDLVPGAVAVVPEPTWNCDVEP